ncbi:MAG: DUF1684 domain-containing protein [Ferruginibacter sp.]|nr:DUF1684 domain-containing protein [Chitinophagaceae bacterium]
MKLKTPFLFLTVCFFALSSPAQSSYRDSLMNYQHHYKKDLYAIIKKDTAYVKFYPVDSSYRIVARVKKLYEQNFFPMATSDNKAHEAIKYAALQFNLHGKEYTLFAYQLSFLMSSAEHKNNFFIPFTDGTSGIDSYSGGKYIDFVTGDISADNILVIDFNRSYNPYCAFKKGYSCPIPPKENSLPVAIWAGEMDFYK